MKKNFIIVLLVFCQAVVFAQDKKIMKIAKYIEKGKGTEAKELLDELDTKKEYQSDIYYWYLRTVYYRNVALANTNSKSELAEARKSFEKLVEFDKTDPSKSFTQYIPQIKKDLYEGQNQIIKSGSNSQSGTVNQANDGKTVTLTQIGQGKTKDAAKYNALRNAIEKAFGTFISSNTTLLNNELVKDEIVSVSSGNIQNFEILSETQMPDGSFSSVVKATVSIGKLTTFCESKGISVEFKGELFAANIKLQELNKENEEDVMFNLHNILSKIVENGFDYKIIVGEPKKVEPDYLYNNIWQVDFSVLAIANKNLWIIKEITISTVNSICLNPEDINTYRNLNIKIFEINISGKKYYFRSRDSILYLYWIFEKKLPLASLNFSVSDGINKYEGFSMPSFKLNENHYSLKAGQIYRRGISAEYYVFFTTSSSPHFMTDVISKFLENVTLSEIKGLSNSYTIGDYRISDAALYLDQFNAREESFKHKQNVKPVEILYHYSSIYTTEQLSKVSEYKVQPIMK